jgi:glutamate synthase domain-containing protein 1
MLPEKTRKLQLPFGGDKVIDACSLFGMMSTSGKRFSGRDAITAIANMHERGNGLGGGFAGYGIYPEHADKYALHIMFMADGAKETTERFLEKHFKIHHDEEIPHDDSHAPPNPPLLRRYFISQKNGNANTRDDDFVVRHVMHINTKIDDAFVFSSGKNMGVFKGLGFPEGVGEFYKLDDYKGYIWIAHGRFPTNTQGWWGGAHPFNILDWTVVHNGEISSYGINKRYLEMYDYHCTMHTDSEVLAYAIDLLMRKHRLPVEVAAKIMAPPLWSQIELMPEKEKQFHLYLRKTYGSLLMNGPFTIIVGHEGEMIGLGDRIRLRPLTAAKKDDMVFLSSEESAIRLVCQNLEKAWIPMGGIPVSGKLTEEGLERVRGGG